MWTMDTYFSWYTDQDKTKLEMSVLLLADINFCKQIIDGIMKNKIFIFISQ